MIQKFCASLGLSVSYLVPGGKLSFSVMFQIDQMPGGDFEWVDKAYVEIFFPPAARSSRALPDI